MDYTTHKQRLIEMEARLTAGIDGATAHGREQSEKSVGDSGDASVASQNVNRGFAKAEFGANVLGQVRDALRRIDAGTFGNCAVDGQPIEPQRLEASPWVPYCLKHQEQLEADGGDPLQTM